MRTKRFALFFFILLLAQSIHGAQIVTSLDTLGAIKISLNKAIPFQVGAVVSGVGDFDGDGLNDAAIGAPGFDVGEFGEEFHNGAVFIVFGSQLKRNSGEINLLASDFKGIRYIGKKNARVGQAMSGMIDINRDGFSDLVVGSKSTQSGYVLFGSDQLPQMIPFAKLEQDGVEIINTGYSVSSGGDINGDGYDDILLGNPFSEKKEINSTISTLGRTVVLFGRSTFPRTIDPLITDSSSHTTIYNPLSLGSEMGSFICGGFDWNLDGRSDFAIVAPKGGRDFKGRSWIVAGAESYPIDREPELLYDIAHAKRSIRNASDINADGYPDLLISHEDNTSVILWGGEPTQGFIDLSSPTHSRRTTIIGTNRLFPVGDVNGDHICDIAASIPYRIPMSYVGDKPAGRVIIICGKKEWPEQITITSLLSCENNSLDYVVIDGNESFSAFGASVAGLGDIHGDGFDDIIIGAPSVILPDDSLAVNPGAAYVIQGRSIFECLRIRRSLLPAKNTRLSPKDT